MQVLNNLVSGYFDIAEINAIEHKTMYMSDYVNQLDLVLKSGGRQLLEGSGKVSHEKAIKKAVDEYRKYEVENLSSVEKAYLESIQQLNDLAKTKLKENK